MTRYEYIEAPIDRILPVIDEGDASPTEQEYAEADRLERERLRDVPKAEPSDGVR